jgi:hypothetical protein
MNAPLAFYAAQIRLHALQLYATYGEQAGHTHARAAIRTTAEVLAEMAGREKAVALLDELSNAVLIETKLPDMPALVEAAPPPAKESPRRKTPAWVQSISTAPFLWGTLFGFWLNIMVRALSK